MKKFLLVISILFTIYSSLSAQVTSIRPSIGHRNQSLSTTITVANGVISTATPPMQYMDIYLQQGSTIIYTDPGYNPYVNVYNYFDPFTQQYIWYDSLHTIFNLSGSIPLGLYDVVVIAYIGATPDTNRLIDGFLIRDYAGTVSGNVYFDANQNGLFDTGEPPLINHWIQVAPGGILAHTDYTGHYSVYLDTGNYVISYNPPTSFTQTSAPSTYSVSLPPSSAGNDFGAYSSQVLGDAQNFSVWHHPMRCNVYGYTYIDITNTGVYPEQGNVTLVHSANMPFVSSIPPPDVITGDTLKWYYSNLQPGQTFHIGGPFGNNWMAFNDPAAGQTIWYTTIDSVTDILGAPLRQYTDSFGFAVTCSCDPNEKDVVPQGTRSQHFTPIGSELIYTLNFQNTGNDTAFNILIIDTLDADLDQSTFRVLGSTDPVDVQMSPGGICRFAFENIQLPDSNIDEPGSHGSVTYSIMPNASLPDPTVISNTAYILFDWNEAIVTNTAINTLTAFEPPVAGFLTPVQTVCNNTCTDFVNLSQNSTFYSWSFPGGLPSTSTDLNPQVCYFNDGAHDVTLVAHSVLGSDTISDSLTIVDYMLIYPTPATPTFNQVFDTLYSPQGYTTYQWFYNGDSIIGSTNYFHVATQNGDYSVVVTDANGCEAGAGISNVVVSVSTLISKAGGVYVYPNPSAGRFEVVFNSSKSGDARIELFDAIGQQVYVVNLSTVVGENKFEINKPDLLPGVYMLKTDNSTQVIVSTIIIRN